MSDSDTSDSVQSSDRPSNTLIRLETIRTDSDDDYDPSNLVTAEAISTLQSTNAAPIQNGNLASKSTKGGFVIEDDDEDDEVETNVPISTLHKPSNTTSPVVANVNVTPIQPTQDNDGDLVNDSASINRLTLPSVSVESRAATTTPVSKPLASPALPLFPLSTTAAAGAPSDRTASHIALPQVQLPKTRVEQLQDRIAEDPRGDIDAYLDLISEFQAKNKIDDVRATYDSFLKAFPSANTIWVEYAELEADNFSRLEVLFHRALLTNPNVSFWNKYLEYILRRNNPNLDTTGNARKTITQAYSFALEQVGKDPDAGQLWKDYLSFIKSGDGILGGDKWQDKQKYDILKEVYSQAVVIPSAATNELWTEYHKFEKSFNKQNAQSLLQERTPPHLKAKEAYYQFEMLSRGLQRKTLPRLPPVHGCVGDEEYQGQLAIWKKWIQWELGNPLKFKDDEANEYRKRVLYVYKQATMAMPFEADIWYEAIDFCFLNNMETEGTSFSEKGIAANPTSCLLAFQQADRYESAIVHFDDEDASAAIAAKVREPYDFVIDSLYELHAKTMRFKDNSIERIEEMTQKQMPQSATSERDDSNESQENDEIRKHLSAERENQIKTIENNTKPQLDLIRRTVTYAWIALMRAMRRVQGREGPKKVFIQAAKRSQKISANFLTSDIFAVVALMEHYSYHAPAAAAKLFTKGLRAYPDDEMFALEYIKYLVETNDITNAQATFEKFVSNIGSNPETALKCKPLFQYMHSYESQYGEIRQVRKLEERMAVLYPSDGRLFRFAQRFEMAGAEYRFDATKARPLISIAAQTRPKPVYNSVENAGGHSRNSSSSGVTPRGNAFLSPRLGAGQLPNLDHHYHGYSPKRAYPDEIFSGSDRPMKLARGASPLKGAAGRRLDAKRRMENAATHQQVPPLPQALNIFLSMLPKAIYVDAMLKNIPPAELTVALLQTMPRISADKMLNGAMRAVGEGGGFGGMAYPHMQQPAPHLYGYMPR